MLTAPAQGSAGDAGFCLTFYYLLYGADLGQDALTVTVQNTADGQWRPGSR